MTRPALHPRPAALPTGVNHCGWCGAAWQKSFSHTCPSRTELPTGPSARAMPVGATTIGGPPWPVAARPASKPKRDGSHAQDALYAALVAAGYIDFGAARMDYGYALFPQSMFVREFAWGAYLTPRRRFQADVCFPAARLLVEIEGIAHKIGSRQKGDVLKSQLATDAGFTLLRVLPEQVHSGEAVALIARALNNAPAGEGGKS